MFLFFPLWKKPPHKQAESGLLSWDVDLFGYRQNKSRRNLSAILSKLKNNLPEQFAKRKGISCICNSWGEHLEIVLQFSLAGFVFVKTKTQLPIPDERSKELAYTGIMNAFLEEDSSCQIINMWLVYESVVVLMDN